MKHRKATRAVVGLAIVGLVGTVAATSPANAATKTTKKKVTTKPKATTAAPAPAPSPTPQAAAPAKSGGKAAFGLEAESSEGFLPSSSNCAVSCYQVFSSLAERLFGIDSKGQIVPFLAESITPDTTYKVWTIKVKSGIKFHNGESLNADAVKANIDDFSCGSVTLSTWFPLNAFGTLCKGGKLSTGVASDGASTVTVTLPFKWVSLPAYLAGGQTYMMAPAQLKAAAPDNRNKPIGTGAFKFKEWVVGDHLTVTKNADYWRKDHMANLDEIEFRPIPDESARLAQLEAGQIDFMQTANRLAQDKIESLQKAGKITFAVGSPTFGEVSYNMLNVAVPPFNSRNCRLAAAYGLDNDTIIKLRAPGAIKANGPFPEGALGYIANNGYPQFNLAKAKEAFDKCKADQGGGDVTFTLGTTTVPDNIITAGIQKQMMEAVGFKVNMVNIEQQKYIGVALVGAFQWFQWRSHGGWDPDQQRVWWHSEMANLDPATKKPILDGKSIAINFNRIVDGTVDSAFDQIRTNSDPNVRKKAAEQINSAFADQVYSLWGWRTQWTIAACKTCGGYTGAKTPSGAATQDFPTGLIWDVANLTKG